MCVCVCVCAVPDVYLRSIQLRLYDTRVKTEMCDACYIIETERLLTAMT